MFCEFTSCIRTDNSLCFALVTLATITNYRYSLLKFLMISVHRDQTWKDWQGE